MAIQELNPLTRQLERVDNDTKIIADITSNTTVSLNSEYLPVDTTSGDVTIALPLIATSIQGKVFYIRKIDASGNSVIIEGSGSDTVDGSASYSLDYQNATCKVVAGTGSDWWVSVSYKNEGAPDHGGLTGLSDDDHSQYVLVNGSRDITGDFTFQQDVVIDGSLAINAAVGSYRFVVDGGNATSAWFESGTNEVVAVFSGDGDRYAYISFRDSTTASSTSVFAGADGDGFILGTGGITRMRVNSAGHVSIGGTAPDSYGSTYDSIQIGGTAVLASQASVGGGENLLLMQGASIDDTPSYQHILNDEASLYFQGGGRHAWYRSGSGTGTITWTQFMVLSYSGNLLIGTSPSEHSNARLQVFYNDDGISVDCIGGTIACFENNTAGWIQMFSGVGYYKGFLFNEGTDADGAQFRYYYDGTAANSYYEWRGNASNWMILKEDGITQFGGNITFPASQNASSDLNTLDDYEEGTFTPTLYGSSGSSGVSYSTRAGAYTKIGDTVHVQLFVELTSKGTLSGSIRISGLPFTADSGGDSYCPAAISYSRYFTLTADHVLQAYVNGATGYFVLQEIQFQNDATGSITTANIADNTTIMISATYRAAA